MAVLPPHPEQNWTIRCTESVMTARVSEGDRSVEIPASRVRLHTAVAIVMLHPTAHQRCAVSGDRPHPMIDDLRIIGDILEFEFGSSYWGDRRATLTICLNLIESFVSIENGERIYEFRTGRRQWLSGGRSPLTTLEYNIVPQHTYEHEEGCYVDITTYGFSFVGRIVTSQKPPQPESCQGCCHYHGRVYGGNMLVCGMHPYGAEEDSCPDWEDGKPLQEPDYRSPF
ncbi:hypothetical protein IQ268_08565 [Oculatella sp. LEGE 06141]|uniref:hypothetical protein n=1 Tax=Oculatella sp. LEGE 06141 TaxID=1828648 RepID=UPI001882B90A|nr:hypothetical protein [Oculatella sp. LEGE 06141]MBE9178610.1 hypothetical protein [Oculatella sp. LEGE 06141]